MNRRDRVLIALVPALVLAVAGWQHVRARTVDQSSWSGAGFGMFATYENEQTRFVLLWLGGGNDREPVAVPGSLARQVEEAKVVPTEARLSAIGRAAHTELGLARGIPLTVELWGIAFDHDTARVDRQLIESVEVGG